MTFYPAGAVVPQQLLNDEFLLRPLRTTDVELDFAALMVSNRMLRRWSGGKWPADDFTIAENLVDLERHEREHVAREAFTYTMIDGRGEVCLGCVYIDPLRALLQLADNLDPAEINADANDEAIVRFWVRQPRIADNLDRRLLNALIEWLDEQWTFRRIFFRANERDLRQVTLLMERGLSIHYTVHIPGRNGRYFAFGPLKKDKNP